MSYRVLNVFVLLVPLILTGCGSGKKFTDWSDIKAVEAHMARSLGCKWEDKIISNFLGRICIPKGTSAKGNWADSAVAAYATPRQSMEDPIAMALNSGIWVLYEKLSAQELETGLRPFGLSSEMISAVTTNAKDIENGEIFEIKTRHLGNFDNDAYYNDTKSMTVRLRRFEE